MKKTYSIGEVAALHNMRESTLRYYDQKGIFQPKMVDASTNYRYYTIEQFPELELIKFLRYLHLPLHDIKVFLENRTPKSTVHLLETQLQSLKEKQTEIESMTKIVERKLQNLHSGIVNEKTKNRVFYQSLPERPIQKMQVSNYLSDEEFTIHLIELQKRLHSQMPAMITSHIGTFISKKGLLSGNYLDHSGLFVSVEDPAILEENYITIPEGLYACTYHYGDYDINRETYDRLLKQIKEDGYEIIGDSIEIGVIDSSVTNQMDEFVTEYQVPVKKRNKKTS